MIFNIDGTHRCRRGSRSIFVPVACLAIYVVFFLQHYCYSSDDPILFEFKPLINKDFIIKDLSAYPDKDTLLIPGSALDMKTMKSTPLSVVVNLQSKTGYGFLASCLLSPDFMLFLDSSLISSEKFVISKDTDWLLAPKIHAASNSPRQIVIQNMALINDGEAETYLSSELSKYKSLIGFDNARFRVVARTFFSLFSQQTLYFASQFNLNVENLNLLFDDDFYKPNSLKEALAYVTKLGEKYSVLALAQILASDYERFPQNDKKRKMVEIYLNTLIRNVSSPDELKQLISVLEPIESTSVTSGLLQMTSRFPSNIFLPFLKRSALSENTEVCYQSFHALNSLHIPGFSMIPTYVEYCASPLSFRQMYEEPLKAIKDQ
jgi:hypothetical protein